MTASEVEDMGRAGRYGLAASCGVAANVFLGLSSLYWRALGSIPPLTLLMFRILLSLLSLMLLIGALRQFRSLWETITAKACAIHACAAVLVVINWASFIWASINGHVVESGLGYLVAPFVALGLGALAFKEPLSRPRMLAVVLIVLTVLWLIWQSADLVHWVYLTIGLTWGGYACLKKLTPLDSIGGLFVETLVLAALIPVFIASTSVTVVWPETLNLNLDLDVGLLLLMSGVVSVFPLYLFAKAAAGLPLSVMGLFQFVLPTTQLVVALAFYRQPVSTNTLTCFAVIWLSLSIIVLEPVFRSLRNRIFQEGA